MSIAAAKADHASKMADIAQIRAYAAANPGAESFFNLADEEQAKADVALACAYRRAFTQSMWQAIGEAITEAISGHHWCKGYDYHRVYVGRVYVDMPTILHRFRNGELTAERIHFYTGDQHQRRMKADMRDAVLIAVQTTYDTWREEQA